MTDKELLEKAANEFFPIDEKIMSLDEQSDQLLRQIGFKFGARWQYEQFEKDYANLCNGIVTAKGIAVAMAYDKGVADAKEQMMSKAIRGRVSVNVESNYHSLIYGCWDMDNALINYNEGDKVKVIVIKEE